MIWGNLGDLGFRGVLRKPRGESVRERVIVGSIKTRNLPL